MAASAIDNNVVGNKIKSMPRLNVAAQNPPISPGTPPPNTISNECLSKPRAVIFPQISSHERIFFLRKHPIDFCSRRIGNDKLHLLSVSLQTYKNILTSPNRNFR